MSFATTVTSLENRYGSGQSACTYSDGAVKWNLAGITLVALLLPRQSMIEVGYWGKDPSGLIDCEDLYHWTQLKDTSGAK